MKRVIWLLLYLTISISAFGQEPSKNPIDLSQYEHEAGFFDLYHSSETGKLLLGIPKDQRDFLYSSGLASGLGSNDIGLDRGQLGDEKVVYLMPSGKKLLLIQRNLDYRAVSDNEAERKAVEEAFAQSVLSSFPIVKEEDARWIVDASKFVIRDAHGTAKRVTDRKQGSFKLDKERSAIYPDRCKSFPDNTEMEALLTFAGEAKGNWLRSVSPDNSSFAVRQHHSFVRLPDDKYEPRAYHAQSGYIHLEYKDYAQPISESLERRYILRHRLEKINPGSAPSEAVEPIIYYIDPGCPEPIKSALIEGGQWWNQAFTAAGYINAFQIKELPAEADPLDVRYNIIQWVHRSTRGWSYGASVIDPRTGEIIKGHVSLGSLRVRQDYLIAQGLKAAFDGSQDDKELVEMALARLRQLSAHEIGHTIGLVHNFAASTADRASVMDYPHPYITLTEDGRMDFGAAYDTGIGEWDIQAIKYGYADFGKDEKIGLMSVLKETNDMSIPFVSDRDARDPSGAHPLGHLWDNGADPTAELHRLLDLREVALSEIGADNIPSDRPLSYLQNVIVPTYFMHRYQVEAVAKIIGYRDYSYAYKDLSSPASPEFSQEAALSAILKSMRPERLQLPADLKDEIKPLAQGYNDRRELSEGNMGPIFDPVSLAAAHIDHCYRFILDPQRLNRVAVQERGQLDLPRLLDIISARFDYTSYAGEQLQFQLLEEQRFIHALIRASRDSKLHDSARAEIQQFLRFYRTGRSYNRTVTPHVNYLIREIQMSLEHPTEYEVSARFDLPPGSPIGCGGVH